MSSPSRPPRLTTACLFLGLASGLLAVSSVSGLSNLMSIDMRQSVSDAMSTGPLDASGISVDTVLSWMRWVLTAGTILAACAVIFSIYAWRGHRPSRIIVTVWAGVAALFFVGGGLWGILPAAFCVYCAVVLWTTDVRRWFAAVNGAPADSPNDQSNDQSGGQSGNQNNAERQSHQSQQSAQPQQPPQDPGPPQQPESQQQPPQGQQRTEAPQQSQQQPPATSGGDQLGQPDDPYQRPPLTVPTEQVQSVQAAGPAGQTPVSGQTSGTAQPGQRPQPIVAAGIITLVGSVPVLLVCGINALYAILAHDSYARLLGDSEFLSDSLDSVGMSAESFVQLVAVFCSVAAIAAVLAVIAGVGLLLNRRWGLWPLRVLTIVTIVIGVLGLPIGLLWSAAAVAVLVLLFRRSVGRWHRG